MLTKYILQIGEERHELTSESIRNWDQVLCAFSRKDFSGAIRSFSSKFEFVGIAYDMLLEHYLRDGVNARALLTVLTITDNWEWEPQFEAPLDFSTITWDGLTLGIAAIDNSLGALINARKGAKYEMVVGEDIASDMKLEYDRLLMSNAVTHEIMGNNDTAERPRGSREEDILLNPASKFTRLPTYVVGEGETYENSPISFQDESAETGSYFLKVERAADFNIDIDITFLPICNFFATINSVEMHLMQFDASNPNYNGSYIDLGTVLSYNQEPMQYLGCFSSFEALKEAYPNPEQGSYAIIGKSNKYDEVEAVYATPYTNHSTVEWFLAEKSLIRTGSIQTASCSTRRYIYSFSLSGLPSGAMFGLFYKADVKWDVSVGNENEELVFAIRKSSIKTSWKSRAKAISIDALSPIGVAKALVDRIAEGKLNVDVHISPYDARIADTAILAAESVRGIPGAKFYSSFSDFCDWMQSVFGYTYCLGEFKKSQFVGYEPFAGSYALAEGEELLSEECPAGELILAPHYLPDQDLFAVYGSNSGCYYSQWPASGSVNGSSAYNANGHARRDKVYVTVLYKHPYYLGDGGALLHYSGDPALCHMDRQSLSFLHRKELFTSDDVREIGMCRDLTYSVDNSLLYSSVEIGYDKQDYEAECGRDEWNFTNRYTTGLDITISTLSLISKYRADCYGLEFLAQKRAKEDTDDKSDNTVFFVHCEVKESDSPSSGDGEVEDGGYVLAIKRSAAIEGAISDTVFNGEYSPHRCLLANADYIAAMGAPARLTFASSDGNSDIVIDGVACNSDFTLESQLFGCGELSFTTGDVDFPPNPDALLSVTHRGVRYRGYLKQVTLRYARAEAAKYKLIVKDIEICW